MTCSSIDGVVPAEMIVGEVCWGAPLGRHQGRGQGEASTAGWAKWGLKLPGSAAEASADPGGSLGLGDPSELSHLQTGGKALMRLIVQPLERDWASCLHWDEFLRGLSGGLSTTNTRRPGEGLCPARVWVSPPPTTGNIAVPTSGYNEPGIGIVLCTAPVGHQQHPGFPAEEPGQASSAPA